MRLISIFLLFTRFQPHIASSPGSDSAEGVIRLALSQFENARFVYEKIKENERCDGPKLTSEKVSNFRECKQRCASNDRCRFFAFWSKNKRCETYENCFTTSPDGKNAIMLYAKMNECDRMLGWDGNGPYIQKMETEFENRPLRSQGPNRNFFCKCVSNLIMICGIFVVPRSSEDQMIRARLSRTDLIALKPFYIFPSLSDPGIDPIYFDPSSGLGYDWGVHAEIEILTPSNCIPINICKGKCPVTGKEFQLGDPVYILEEDAKQVKQGKSVPCVSLGGLRVVSRREAGAGTGFDDPHKRMPGKKFLIGKDYTMYFLFSESQLSEGVCGRVHNEAGPSALKTNVPTSSPTEQKSSQKSSFWSDLRQEIVTIQHPKKEPLAREGSPARPPVVRVKSVQRSQTPPAASPESPELMARRSKTTASWRSQGHFSASSEDHSPDLIPGAAASPEITIEKLSIKQGAPSNRDPTHKPTLHPTPNAGSSSLADLHAKSARSSEEMNNEPTLQPTFEVGSQKMLAGIPGEPGYAGMIATIIQNLPDGRVAVQLGPKQFLKTRRENLVGKDDLNFHLSNAGQEGDAKYPRIGDQMMIQGLKKSPEYNGMVGVVTDIFPDKNRVALRVRNDEIVTVNPKNLLASGFLSKFLKSQVAGALGGPSSVAKSMTNESRSGILTAALLFIIFFTFFTYYFLHLAEPAADHFYIEFEDFKHEKL